MRIYMVRHGQSIGNLTGDFSTDAHDQLSDLGHRQAAALAEYLSQIKWDAIYCSPLIRALQTINPFAELQKTQVEIWPDLAESCWQDDQRVKEDDRVEYIPMKWPAFLSKDHFYFRNNEALQPSYNETYSQGISRLRQFLQSLLRQHGGQDESVLLVSHGFSLSRLVEMLMGLEPNGRFDHENTALTCLEERRDSFQLCFSNRLIHALY